MSQQGTVKHTTLPTVMSHEKIFDFGSEGTWCSHTDECVRLVLCLMYSSDKHGGLKCSCVSCMWVNTIVFCWICTIRTVNNFKCRLVLNWTCSKWKYLKVIGAVINTYCWKDQCVFCTRLVCKYVILRTPFRSKLYLLVDKSTSYITGFHNLKKIYSLKVHSRVRVYTDV